MKSARLAIIWATGVAIFSMFFGSGNVVFPLQLGKVTGDWVWMGALGLMVTAIGAPIMGLLGAVLFEGDCKAFFFRMGKIPGYLAVLLIIGLIGPFGVMPRCFVVSYSAVQPYFPDLSLLVFSVISGILTLIFIAKRHFILPILGCFLSPLLLVSLVVIIGVGLGSLPHVTATEFSGWEAFRQGFFTGYDTMDLLASIFFAVSIWMLLKEQLNIETESQIRSKLIPTYIWSSLLAGLLLGLIYLGLCVATAWHSDLVQQVQPEALLATLAIKLLGSKLAIIANIAIALACFTTVMALAVATVDVIHVEFENSKIAAKLGYHYNWMVLIVVAITVALSNLGFKTIMIFLHSVMVVCYPAIIVLTLCNILYKLYNFQWVKTPVFLTLILTLAYYSKPWIGI